MNANQYFLRTSDRAVRDFVAPLDTATETASSRGSITKDVPILRIDNLAGKPSLLRVRRCELLKAVAATTNQQTPPF
jgi:hypothetical protein